MRQMQTSVTPNSGADNFKHTIIYREINTYLPTKSFRDQEWPSTFIQT